MMYSRLLLVLSVLTTESQRTNARTTGNSTFALAEIPTATPNSTTFSFVTGSDCNSSVISTVYGVYTKNRNLFDECVTDSAYQIFPHTGTSPSRDQIEAMADSVACGAILTAVVLSGVPECNVTSMPLRAAAETMVKVGVDVKTYPTQRAKTVPSSERFMQMMLYRRDSNLARAAGQPYDAGSQLFKEFEANLKLVKTNKTVRLLADLTVEYTLSNGTVVRGSSLVANSSSSDTNSSGYNSMSSRTNDTTSNQVVGFLPDTNSSTKATSAASSASNWRVTFVVVIVALVRLANAAP